MGATATIGQQLSKPRSRHIALHKGAYSKSRVSAKPVFASLCMHRGEARMRYSQLGVRHSAVSPPGHAPGFLSIVPRFLRKP